MIMNKKNIHIVTGIIISFLVLLILGCSYRSDNKTAINSEQQSATYKDASDGAMQDGMIEIVDIVGRTVTVPAGDVKVIIYSRMIYALASLFGKDGNPFTHIVGWDDRLHYDPDTYETYLEKFPEMSSIASLGGISKGDFSIEKAINLNPDIILVNSGKFFAAREIGLIKKLNKAGIKTVFVDFRENPIQNAIPSMLLLGQIFEKTVEAGKFLNFYFAQMQKVSSIVEKIKEEEKPLVFMEYAPNSGKSKAGEYKVFGHSSFGHFVELAGGKNYGTEIFGPKTGIISAEQVLMIDPDVIIGTGGNWSKKVSTSRAVVLGHKATKKGTQERLKDIVSRTGWETLKAVKNKRVHSTWHQFKSAPYHFIAIQQMAKWFYPDKFADLDPEETFKQFYDEFLPIDYSGMFWASLE